MKKERELIAVIKEALDELLENAPQEYELADDEVCDFYAEAKNLQEAIENMGW